MKSTWTLIAALTMIALAIPVAAEQIKEIDRRDDVNASGKLLVFSWHPFAKNGTNGECIILLGTGESAANLTIEASFGVFKDGGKMVVSSLTNEQAALIRAGTGVKEANTLSCAIDDEQYARAKAIFERYGAQESFEDSPTNVILNISGGIIAAVGLKAPYRSGLAGTQPLTYFDDLKKLNRDLKR